MGNQPSDQLPIFSTNTRNFNNAGINKLFNYVFSYIKIDYKDSIWNEFIESKGVSVLYTSNYLKYIIDTIKNYKRNLNISLNNLRLVQSYYDVLRYSDRP